MKKALLVVSFGSSYHEAIRDNIYPVEECLKAAFPDRSFQRAFGSKMILRKLRSRDSISIPSIPEALETLAAQGFQDVLVQPTYFIPGREYMELQSILQDYAAKFPVLTLGRPLLDCQADFKEVIDGLMASFPLAEKECLVLMGHGTEHFANTAYPALEHMIHTIASDKMFVGTVEGYPEITDVVEKLHRSGCKKVFLTAFMLVAGDHARNDMAGEEADSWKSILEREGFEVSCIMKGFGSYPFIQDIFQRHALETR